MENWLVKKLFLQDTTLTARRTQYLIDTWVNTKHYLRSFSRYLPKNGRDTSSFDVVAASATQLMQVHYDKPLALFEAFLGSTMKYSMGLWDDEG